jgi:hypothetical protein
VVGGPLGSYRSDAAHIGGMTSLGLDLSDLGIDDVTAPVTDTDETAAAPRGGSTLAIGSTLAKALYSIWNGDPVVVVDSPPGSGKTTMVGDMVVALVERTNLSITIASPTRRGAYDIAERIAAQLGPDKDGKPRIALGVRDMEPPAGVAKGGVSTARLPIVRTVASCKAKAPICDVMIFDEAYQTTFADAASAADGADQVVFVGDPGQIGPVVTADMTAFRGYETTPATRAPEVFSLVDGAKILSLATTYRLGQETVDAIAPLYNFKFSSARPDRYLTDEYGNRVSEIASVQLPLTPTNDDLNTMVSVASYAAGMVGAELIEHDAEGRPTARVLTEADIAVVVSHNSQSASIAAILTSMKAGRIHVGTADRMQGGQWHAVVALDPMVGYASASTHQLSPGRMCVMASRHMTHLTWMHDGGWETALADPSIDQKDAKLGRLVREALTA